MKLVPKKVSKNTGMNPVARAVARAALKQAILDQKIQLYLLEEGAPCANECIMIAQMLAALVEAAELDKTVGKDDVDVRIMRGALSACEQMIAADKFARINVTSLDKGLDAAFAVNMRVSPEAFTRAWNSKPRING
jgi:hypothetical protein